MNARHLALFLLLAVASAAYAGPVPCDGGTLDFTATSDTPFTLPTFNVGQQTTLTAVAAGFTITTATWTIPGPHIKDYSDDLGTMEDPVLAAPLPFTTMPLTPADLAANTVTFYWKPSAAQTHPLTGGPEARMVTLDVTTGGGVNCSSSTSFMIERNLTNPDKQPEDLFTSTHRAITTTNPLFGRVVDEHMFWHQFVGGGADGHWLQFLAWHGYFLRRFDEWRTEFGYATVNPWYPGRPLPTGPEFDHPASLRIPFNPDSNRIPTYFTIAGGTAVGPGGTNDLADFASLNDFSDSFEGGYHGTVHCNIGTSAGGFFDTDGPGFGSMCNASSPKDPLFWRWHGFIDVMYRNYCKLKSIACHSGPDPASDPWMGDNPADIAANGTVPSPTPLWLSPDVWNRRSAVATVACNPANSTGGVTRDCGSSADHENPVTGVPNFLYATLRNTRPTPMRNVYAEVAVYYANASTGLSYPVDFTMLPQSRQFITLTLEPNQVTDIGPLPWTPPSPMPTDHFCLYVRVLSVQETPFVDGATISTNVANSNSRSWRNVKIVEPGDEFAISSFMVRNIRETEERLVLQIDATPALLQRGIQLQFHTALARAFDARGAKLDGVRLIENGTFEITAARARIDGIRLAPRGEGAATLRLAGGTEGEIRVTQRSAAGIDGGVNLRIARRGSREAENGFELPPIGGTDEPPVTAPPRQLYAGVLAGTNWPLGNFNDRYEPSTLFAIQLERAWIARWRLGIQAGHHEFDEKFEGSGNLGITNLSLFARFSPTVPPAWTTRPYLLFGPGAYRAGGTWRAGMQAGAGLEVPVSTSASLMAGFAIHHVSGGRPKPQWIDGYLGVLFRFP